MKTFIKTSQRLADEKYQEDYYQDSQKKGGLEAAPCFTHEDTWG